MSILKNKEKELRSGWKITFVLLCYFLFATILTIIFESILGIIYFSSNKGSINTAGFLNYVMNIIKDNPIGHIITEIIDFIGLLFSIFIFLILIDKKSFKDIGMVSLKKGMKNFIYGLLLGAVSISLIFFVLLFTKNLKIENSIINPKFSMSAIYGIVIFIIVGFKEEILSRGYCITVLNQMKKPYISIIISSLIFSSLHILNPNVKLLGLANIFLVGILFGYMYIKTKNLWMPIGYHITWNYFQGNVFGFPVSGINQNGIYNIINYNDNILTGGSFGPEAGILTTLIILLGLLVIWRTKDNDV